MDAAIVGDDLGYSHVKTHTMFICPSRATQSEPLLGHHRTLEVDGKKYYIGIGNGNVDVNKINSELTRVLLLYSICASTTAPVVRVVTGLPIGQYRTHKTELRDMVLQCRGPVVYNGVLRSLRIEDCIVRPQGVMGNGLYVDIGGRTTDIAYVAGGDLMYAKTLYDGMIGLAGRIMAVVNSKFTLALPDDYAWTILKEGLTIGGQLQDTACVTPVLADFADTIVAEITMAAEIGAPVICGGGAKIMYTALHKRMPACVLAPEPQFANAIMYRKVGEKAWLS